MRTLFLTLALVACSSGGTSSQDAGLPIDDAAVSSARERIAQVCVGADAGPLFPTPAERIAAAVGAWNVIRAYAVPSSEIEASRLCVCGMLGDAMPADVAADTRSRIREACCGRDDASVSAWCP